MAKFVQYFNTCKPYAFTPPGDEHLFQIQSVPAIAVISWIPYFSDFAGMPSNGWTDLQSSDLSHTSPFGSSAIPLLFHSGNISEPAFENDPCPESFRDGRGGLEDLLKSKNYRGISALDQIRILRNQNGDPVEVLRDECRFSGYTPIRILGDHPVGFLHGKLEEVLFEPLTRGTSVVLQSLMKFRLCTLIDVLGAISTRRFAPWVWVKISYRIDMSSAQAAFEGSYIPSQAFYVDWKKEQLHNMLEADSLDIRRFLESGRPLRELHKPPADAPARSSRVTIYDIPVRLIPYIEG